MQLEHSENSHTLLAAGSLNDHVFNDARQGKPTTFKFELCLAIHKLELACDLGLCVSKKLPWT